MDGDPVVIPLPSTRKGPGLDVLLQELEQRLRPVVSRVEPEPLRECLWYGLEGGKRVRPLLLILSCEAAGCSALDALDAGVAVELLHTASLVHDDIMDESAHRRGKVAVHLKFGLPLAILAGDTMTAVAFSIVSGISAARQGDVHRLFAQTFQALCEGQAQDILASHTTSTAHHRSLVEKKTAKLLEACASMGALLACADPPVVERMSTFGNRLGMAFQVKDDLIDATGSERESGKSVGTDRRNGRRTFLGNTGREVSLRSAKHALHRYTRDACNALLALPPSNARELLLDHARNLSVRTR